MLIQILRKNKNYLIMVEVAAFKLSLVVVVFCGLSSMLSAAAAPEKPQHDPAFGPVMQSDGNLKSGENKRNKRRGKVRPAPENDFQRGVVAHMDDPNCFGPVLVSEHNLRDLRTTAAVATSDDAVAVLVQLHPVRPLTDDANFSIHSIASTGAKELPRMNPFFAEPAVSAPITPSDNSAHCGSEGEVDRSLPARPLTDDANFSIHSIASTGAKELPRMKPLFAESAVSAAVTPSDSLAHRGSEGEVDRSVHAFKEQPDRSNEVSRSCCQRLLYYLCCGCCCKK